MNGTTLERPDVAAYLDAVRSRLADLPTEERDDLVADVEASLLESGEPPLLSPEDFAAELREAAGLSPEAPVAPAASPLDALRSWLSTERVASWRRTATELAPVWWLARAFVAVAVLEELVNGNPIGAETGGAVSLDWTVVALIAASVISIWLGLRGRRGHGPDRRIRLAVNIALALALLPAAVVTLERLESGGTSYVYSDLDPTPGLALDGVQIQNVYPYSREGKPLFDVLLYDENGQPVSIVTGPDDTSRRILADENGTQFYNSFPIRYFDPGTKTVGRPRLAPPIPIPNIVTPALEVQR